MSPTIPSYYYDHFLYILSLFINENLNQSEKNTIISTIYDKINGELIKKRVFGANVEIKWRIEDKNDLLHYYTNIYGTISDEGIFEHTKQVLSDVREIVGENKFSFIITKPITKNVCML